MGKLHGSRVILGQNGTETLMSLYLRIIKCPRYEAAPDESDWSDWSG